MNKFKPIILLAIIMVAVVSGVTGAAFFILFDTALEQKRDDLVQIAKSQARLIEAAMRHQNIKNPAVAWQRTLEQIRDAHGEYEGFGETGEFTLARRKGDEIVFVLRHRHFDLDNPKPVPFASNHAEPMRKALLGQAGTVIGLDYRGETVLAAYEPVGLLKLGIVAKIDLTEVRAPFIKAGTIITILSAVIVMLGVGLFFLVSSPMVMKLQKSEARFKDFAETTSDWFWEMDADFRFSYFSDHFPEITGVTQITLLGKTREETGIPNVDPDVWANHLADLKAHREFSNFVHPRTNTSGQEVWLSINGKPVFDEGGVFQGYRGTGTDITEHKENIRELGFQKYALDEHAIVSIANVKGDITYINDKFCEISGYTEEELLGHSHRMLKSDEHPPEFFTDLWKTIANGKTWRGEIKNNKKDGGYYWVDATIVPFLNEESKPFQYVSIRTDITDLKQAENDRNKALVEAEQANQAKSEFLASMSHEIRTPMTGVMGFADLLLEDNLSKVSKDRVYKIKDATRSLLRIINDILDVSKLEAGKMEVESIDFHLPSTIDDVLALFEEKRKGKRGKGLSIEVIMADDFPEGVKSDPTRIRQILVNLIGNAVKFTEAGGIKVKGSLIQSDEDKVLLRFAIHDTGIGIKPEIVNKLFAEFTQADASISRRFEGSGLGLSICKRLVELMGGEIGAESELSKGSTFWFTLPYVAATSDVSEQFWKKVSTITHCRANRPLHILIVEDNKLNQEIITATVAGFGHTSEVAEDGMMAVEMHERGYFDLILMDIRMPVMSGPDATRLIRQKDGDKAKIPIIALTADALEEHKVGYFEAGMDDISAKPIDRAHLALTINKVMDEEIHVAMEVEQSTREEPNASPEEEVVDEEVNAAVDDFLKQIRAVV